MKYRLLKDKIDHRKPIIVHISRLWLEPTEENETTNSE